MHKKITTSADVFLPCILHSGTGVALDNPSAARIRAPRTAAVIQWRLNGQISLEIVLPDERAPSDSADHAHWRCGKFPSFFFIHTEQNDEGEVSWSKTMMVKFHGEVSWSKTTIFFNIHSFVGMKGREFEETLLESPWRNEVWNCTGSVSGEGKGSAKSIIANYPVDGARFSGRRPWC